MRRHLALDDDSLRVGAAGAASIPLGPDSRVFLVAAGKASPAMTSAALDVAGARIAAGVVAHPHAANLAALHASMGRHAPGGLRAFGAGHPLPDEGSIGAGDAVVALLGTVRPGDVVLVLLSGGGSALLESLRPGLTLDDLRGVTGALQRAGADIGALNTVRRALSRLKGGGLARLAGPARVVTLALSDVIGDRPEAIASGPTVPSPTGPSDALAILDRFGIGREAANVVAALRAADLARPPAPREAEDGRYVIVGSNAMAAAAVRAEAERRGYAVTIVTLSLAGEAREAGARIGAAARAVRGGGKPLPAPACLIYGGETTVTVRGEGHGGRNLEVALGAALAIEGLRDVAVLAFATDGVDGISRGAGALVTGETIAHARVLGADPEEAFAKSDTEAFFEKVGGLWVTGPTGTNVNDLAVVLLDP